MRKADDDKTAVETFGAVTIVFRNAVTGEQKPCRRLKRKRILVLFLHGQKVLADKSLEDAVVIDVLSRKVSEDIRQLAKQFCRLETLIQRLPGYIAYIFLAQE